MVVDNGVADDCDDDVYVLCDVVVVCVFVGGVVLVVVGLAHCVVCCDLAIGLPFLLVGLPDGFGVVLLCVAWRVPVVGEVVGGCIGVAVVWWVQWLSVMFL